MTIFLAVFLFIFFHFGFKVSSKKFSGEEISKLELIKQVKKFALKIGLKPTDNFKKFVEEQKDLKVTYAIKKGEVPFSYLDPKLIKCDTDDRKKLEEELPGHDFFTVTYTAYAGGSMITRHLLKQSKKFIAEAVFHEDLHDSVDIPRHFEEAAATIVGLAAYAAFKDYAPEKTLISLADYERDYVIPYLDCFREIEELDAKMAGGKIKVAQFNEKKDQILKRFGREDFCGLVVQASYYHYFGLLVSLFRSLDCNVSNFIRFFADFPFKDCKVGGDIGFKKTRENELLMEEFIKEFILRNPPKVL